MDVNVKEDGFIYLMENTESLNVKIGISRTDPRLKRTKQLNSGTKNDGEIRCIKTVKCHNFEEGERVLHRIYRRFRIRGEWFRLPTEERVAFMLLTPSQITRMIEMWNMNRITSLQSLMVGNQLFYQGKAEFLDHLHETNERLIAEKTAELVAVKKQKQELETQLQAIKFNYHRQENPTASIVRSSLAAMKMPEKTHAEPSED